MDDYSRGLRAGLIVGVMFGTLLANIVHVVMASLTKH